MTHQKDMDQMREDEQNDECILKAENQSFEIKSVSQIKNSGIVSKHDGANEIQFSAKSTQFQSIVLQNGSTMSKGLSIIPAQSEEKDQIQKIYSENANIKREQICLIIDQKLKTASMVISDQADYTSL